LVGSTVVVTADSLAAAPKLNAKAPLGASVGSMALSAVSPPKLIENGAVAGAAVAVSIAGGVPLGSATLIVSAGSEGAPKLNEKVSASAVVEATRASLVVGVAAVSPPKPKVKVLGSGSGLAGASGSAGPPMLKAKPLVGSSGGAVPKRITTSNDERIVHEDLGCKYSCGAEDQCNSVTPAISTRTKRLQNEHTPVSGTGVGCTSFFLGLTTATASALSANIEPNGPV